MHQLDAMGMAKAVSDSGFRADPAHMSAGDRFGRLVKNDALDRVADVAAVEHVGDIGQGHHHEPV